MLPYIKRITHFDVHVIAVLAVVCDIQHTRCCISSGSLMLYWLTMMHVRVCMVNNGQHWGLVPRARVCIRVFDVL